MSEQRSPLPVVSAEGGVMSQVRLRRSLPVRRYAVKLAWNDMRRNLTRTVITLLLMGVPVALVVGYTTVLHSEVGRGDLSHGRSELAIQPSGTVGESDFQVAADPAAAHMFAPQDGDGAGSAAAALASLEAASGVRWVATVSQVARVEVAGVTTNRFMLLANGSRGAAGAAAVLSGRWPENPGEVLVTNEGIQSGLPQSGTFTVTVAGESHSVTVVGVGRGFGHREQPVDLIGWLDEAATVPESALYLLAEGQSCSRSIVNDVIPVVWGALMQGRCLPTSDGLAATEQQAIAHDVTTVPVGGDTPVTVDTTHPWSWLLLAVCCMLLGFVIYPSLSLFVEANRPHIRRLFENGAPAAQVRWLVLTQASLLAVAASACGVFVGVVGAGVVQVVAGTYPDGVPRLVFRVPWDVLVACVVTVVLASWLAGLVISRWAQSPKVFAPISGMRRFVPSLVAAGLCSLAGLMVVALFSTGMSWGRPVPFSVVATLGTTALAPFVCVLAAWGVLLIVGRARWWLLRFAARTVQRRVASFTMTALAVGSLSLLSVMMGFVAPVTFSPAVGYGSGYPMAVGDSPLDTFQEPGRMDWDVTLAVVQEALPHNDVHPVVGFARDRGTGPVGLVALAATPPGSDAPGLPASSANTQQDPAQSDPAQPDPVYFGPNRLGPDNTVVVMDGDRAQQVLGLSAQGRAQFESGTVVLVEAEGMGPGLPRGEVFVGVGVGTVNSWQVVEKATDVRWEQVPSLRVKPPLPWGHAVVVVPTGLADRLGVPTKTVAGYVAAGPPLTQADRQAVSQAAPEVFFYGEQERYSTSWWLVLVPSIGAAVAVIVALVLAMVLMRRQLTSDMVALNAIGGPPHSVGQVLGMITVVVGITGSVIGVSMPVIAISGLYLSSTNIAEALGGEGADQVWSWIGRWAIMMGVFIPVPSVIAGAIVALTTRTPPATARSGLR